MVKIKLLNSLEPIFNVVRLGNTPMAMDENEVTLNRRVVLVQTRTE